MSYKIEYRNLVAADYGAPTTRKRFVLIARCDGKPIVWPERTHAPADSEDVKNGKYKPWRSAAEIIDWSLPCPSIFETSEQIKDKYGLKSLRPLKPNTLRRIARGIDKFVIKANKPFIIPVGYGEKQGQKPRVNDIDKPLGTVVGSVKHNVVEPLLVPLTMHNHTNASGTDIKDPVNTITSVGAQMLIAPNLIQYHTEQSEKENRAYGFNEPIKTVDGSARYGISAAHLTQYFKGDHFHSPNDPLHTVTTEIREGVTLAHITKYKGTNIGQSAFSPLQTVTAREEFGAVKTRLEKVTANTDFKYWPEVKKLLNEYCGYSIADDEILALTIGGVDYFISDIGLRMLTAKELYAAQGFPEDYKIEFDYTGKAYPKTQQVARCGNAVCPPMATALVKANMPEYYVADISAMAQFANVVTA